MLPESSIGPRPNLLRKPHFPLCGLVFTTSFKLLFTFSLFTLSTLISLRVPSKGNKSGSSVRVCLWFSALQKLNLKLCKQTAIASRLQHWHLLHSCNNATYNPQKKTQSCIWTCGFSLIFYHKLFGALGPPVTEHI